MHVGLHNNARGPAARWRGCLQDLAVGHEMFCAGHFMEAAVALDRCGGDARSRSVAAGWRIISSARSGRAGGTAWTAIPSWSWRWSSYREVGERRYLDLAAHLIGQRGRGLAGNVYPEHRGGTAVFQDHASVRAAN